MSRGSYLAQQSVVTAVVNFEEVDLEGRFLHLKNSSDKHQCLGNWGIKRQVLEGEDTTYKFTHKYVLKGSQRVTVWAAGTGATQSPHQPFQSVEAPEQLGIGEKFCTVLVKEVTMQAGKQSSGRDNWEEEEEAEFDEDNLFHQQGHPRTTSRGCQLM